MEPRAVVLAAGASRRLGEPKALVDLPGGRPVVRLVRAARAATGEDPLVVTGAHHAGIAACLAAELDAAHLCLHNPDWAGGRTGGLALAADRAPGRDLLVLAVDQPRVDAALLGVLLEAWRVAGAPPTGWLAPGYVPAGEPGQPTADPRPGHPILLGAGLACRLAALDADRPLRDLRAGADPLWMVATNDPAVLDDLDTPDDLSALRLDMGRG